MKEFTVNEREVANKIRKLEKVAKGFEVLAHDVYERGDGTYSSRGENRFLLRIGKEYYLAKTYDAQACDPWAVPLEPADAERMYEVLPVKVGKLR